MKHKHPKRLNKLSNIIFAAVLAWVLVGLVPKRQEYPTLEAKAESNRAQQTADSHISNENIDDYLKRRTVVLLNGAQISKVEVDQSSGRIVINGDSVVGDVLSHRCYLGPVDEPPDPFIFERAARNRLDGQRPDKDEEPFSGAGAAAVIHEDGYLLTAAHVVDFRDTVACVVEDDRISHYPARVVWKAEGIDLALLHIDRHFDRVFELSDQFANDEVCVSFGLSGKASGRRIQSNVSYGKETSEEEDVALKEFHCISNPVLPGDSGGPTINMMGQLVGINIQLQSYSTSRWGKKKYLGVLVQPNPDYLDMLIRDDQRELLKQ